MRVTAPLVITVFMASAGKAFSADGLRSRYAPQGSRQLRPSRAAARRFSDRCSMPRPQRSGG